MKDLFRNLSWNTWKKYLVTFIWIVPTICVRGRNLSKRLCDSTYLSISHTYDQAKKIYLNTFYRVLVLLPTNWLSYWDHDINLIGKVLAWSKKCGSISVVFYGCK